MIIGHKYENVNTFFEKNFRNFKEIMILHEICWKKYEIHDKIRKDKGDKILNFYIKGRIYMENEITFKTSVGGYKRDQVIEYVENMNEQMFCLKKASEEAAANYEAKIKELEELIEEKEAKIEAYDTDNAKLKEDLEKLEGQYKEVHSDTVRLEAEKRILREKLGKEVLKLRAENQELKEKLQEAERNIGSEADYEGVRNAVSEVQYKIAEYVNTINKTQQSLADTYQKMNDIKKKVAEQMENNKK